MMGGYGLCADTGAIVYGAFMGGSVVWAGRRMWCVRVLAGVEKGVFATRQLAHI
jgi:hypothetical protein